MPRLRCYYPIKWASEDGPCAECGIRPGYHETGDTATRSHVYVAPVLVRCGMPVGDSLHVVQGTAFGHAFVEPPA